VLDELTTEDDLVNEVIEIELDAESDIIT